MGKDYFTWGEIPYDNQVLLGVILKCGFPSCTLQFGQEEDLPWYSIESRAYWFILKIARIFPILTSRNRMMSTCIIVNIIPTCKGSYDLCLCFSIPKSPDLSLLFCQEQNIIGHSFEKRAYQFVLKATMVFPILLMGNINPICKR